MKPVKAWASLWRKEINLEHLLYSDKRLGVDTPVVVCPLELWTRIREHLQDELEIEAELLLGETEVQE